MKLSDKERIGTNLKVLETSNPGFFALGSDYRMESGKWYEVPENQKPRR